MNITKINDIILKLKSLEENKNTDAILDGINSVFVSSEHLQDNGKIITIAINSNASRSLKALIENVERIVDKAAKLSNQAFRHGNYKLQKEVNVNAILLLEDIELMAKKTTQLLYKTKIQSYKKGNLFITYLNYLTPKRIQDYFENKNKSNQVTTKK